MLSPPLRANIGKTKPLQIARICRGFEQLVGGTRFELVTPSMSTKCATTAPTALERNVVYLRAAALSTRIRALLVGWLAIVRLSSGYKYIDRAKTGALPDLKRRVICLISISRGVCARLCPSDRGLRVIGGKIDGRAGRLPASLQSVGVRRI